MGTRILLIANNICSTPYPVFPLGVAHVAAALKKASHTVTIIDLLHTDDALESTLRSFKPQYIGLSQRNIDDLNIRDCKEYADTLVQAIRRIRTVTTVPVILGGSGFSLFPLEIFELSGAEYGIQGEGERSLPELIDALKKNRPLEHIPGLIFRSGNRIRVNPQIPNPLLGIPGAWRPPLLSQWYLKQSAMLNIQTQRGCPFTCCYCTYPLIEGKTLRRRDYGDLGEELTRISKTGCKYFFIVDSVFNTSADHAASVCEEIIRRGITMSWGCFLRPKAITPRLMALMARAGLKHIEFGSDSLCDRSLEAYGKKFTFSDIYRASELARDASVHYAHFLIMGGPGETEETVREGFENSKQLRKTVFFPFVGMRIYPRTRLYAIARLEGVIDAESDLLKPRFYLSPGVSEKKLFSLLNHFRAISARWIVDEIPRELETVIRGLRKKGITGPLWEFLAR